MTRIRSRKNLGFTLIEAMVVVSIIAIVAALSAPSVGEALGERRANEVALDVIRLVTRARSEAVGYGRAHLVRFAADGNGSVELYRGTNNRCSSVNWAAVTGPGCDPSNRMCRDWVDAEQESTPGQQIELQSLSGTYANVQLCYEPSGRVLWRAANTGRFSSILTNAVGGTLGGGFRFRVVRNGGEGVTRRIVVGFGQARLLR